MKLKLERPLVFLDIEATGTNVGSDRIVELALIKNMPDGSRTTWLKQMNPEIPIPLVVSEIHGIYDVDVINAPRFADLAGEILEFIGDSDLAGFNSNKFDVPMLLEEFLRAGVEFNMEGRRLLDVQNIFHKKEERTLSAAVKFYLDETLENAHSALADTEATERVFFAQLERYPDLNTDVETLNTFCRAGQRNLDFAGRIVEDDNGVAVFNFGKYKGRSVEEVIRREPSYYHWMMNGDFPMYTKRVLTQLKEKAGL
jgi:DNA polymerase-3 subunit epsilon